MTSIPKTSTSVLRNCFRFVCFEFPEKSGFWKTAIIMCCVRGSGGSHHVNKTERGFKILGKGDYVICECSLFEKLPSMF